MDPGRDPAEHGTVSLQDRPRKADTTVPARSNTHATTRAFKSACEQRLLALQASAGNRAVGSLVARQEPRTATQQVGPIPHGTHNEPLFLPHDRRTIEAETNAEILTAFTAFA